MAAESTSLRSYQIIASNTLGRISWTLIRDQDDNDSYLHIEDLPKNLTMKESYFLGFGFTNQIENSKCFHSLKSSKKFTNTHPLRPRKQHQSLQTGNCFTFHPSFQKLIFSYRFEPVEKGAQLFVKLLSYNILDGISQSDSDDTSIALKEKYPRITAPFLSDNAKVFSTLSKTTCLSTLGEDFVQFSIDIAFKPTIGVFPSITSSLQFKKAPPLQDKTVLHIKQCLQDDYSKDLRPMSYLNIISAIRFETPQVLTPLKLHFTTESGLGYKPAHYFAEIEDVHIFVYGKFDILQDQPSIDTFKKVHQPFFAHYHQLTNTFFRQTLFDRYKTAVTSQPWGGSFIPTPVATQRKPESHNSSLSDAFTKTKARRNEISIALDKIAKSRKTSSSATPSSSQQP
jgi:hypothetical protein